MNALAPDMWRYREWEITCDESAPIASYVWTATGPDFDVDCVDGEWVVSGGVANAATYEELIAEIDGYIEENAE